LAASGWAQISDSKASAAITLAAVLRDEAALAGAHDIEILDGIAYIAGEGFTSRAWPRRTRTRWSCCEWISR